MENLNGIQKLELEFIIQNLIKMDIILNDKDYALFDYTPYLLRGSECEKPKKLHFQLGQVVYLQHTNAIGVVIGCIDEVGEELRTDMDGMVGFDDLRPVKMSDFSLEDVRFQAKLKDEVAQAIYEEAVKVYEKTGQSGVFDFALDVGVNEYKHCEPCDTSSPTADGTSCLVCGSELEEE